MNPTVVLSLAMVAVTGCASLREYHAPSGDRGLGSAAGAVSPDARYQALLDRAVNEHGLVGVQVSIKAGAGPAWHGASGTTGPDRGRPLRPAHVIRLGSLTKTYTAVVVLRLAERGVLGLDDTLRRWLPECRFPGRITVRMLLDHSSGIPDLLGPRIMIGSAMRPARFWKVDELLRAIRGGTPQFEPGSDHRYSNSNDILLGIIAERAAGMPLAALYRGEIFEPLGLRHTYFLPYESAPAELATGFDRDLIPLPGWHATKPGNTAWSSCAHASGAMASTASDVLAFFEAAMNRTIVGEESFRLMTAVAPAVKPEDPYLENFGAGLFRYGRVHRGAYGHLGLFVGSESVALFDPGRRFVFVLLANVSRIRDRDALVQGYLDLLEPR